MPALSCYAGIARNSLRAAYTIGCDLIAERVMKAVACDVFVKQLQHLELIEQIDFDRTQKLKQSILR